MPVHGAEGPATLLLSPGAHTYDSIRLRSAALQRGWAVHRAHPGRVAADPGSVCLYGDPELADAVCRRFGRRALQPPTGWLPGLPEGYRKRTITLETAASAAPRGGPLFAKSPVDRRLPAKVYPSGRDLPPLPPGEPLLVAEPVAWDGEVRAFVLDRSVVALSAYQGRPPLREARRFLAEMLQDPAVSLPPAIVIDAGRVRGRGWAVVEANPAWGSALYGCPPAAVLDVLRRSCVSEGADPGWVRPLQAIPPRR